MECGKKIVLILGYCGVKSHRRKAKCKSIKILYLSEVLLERHVHGTVALRNPDSSGKDQIKHTPGSSSKV